jgi:hypothetical protein
MSSHSDAELRRALVISGGAKSPAQKLVERAAFACVLCNRKTRSSYIRVASVVAFGVLMPRELIAALSTRLDRGTSFGRQVCGRDPRLCCVFVCFGKRMQWTEVSSTSKAKSLT